VCACECAQAPLTRQRSVPLADAAKTPSRSLHALLARLPSNTALVPRLSAWLARCYASPTVNKPYSPNNSHSTQPACMRMHRGWCSQCRSRLSWAHLTVFSTLCRCEERLGCEILRSCRVLPLLCRLIEPAFHIHATCQGRGSRARVGAVGRGWRCNHRWYRAFSRIVVMRKVEATPVLKISDGSTPSMMCA